MIGTIGQVIFLEFKLVLCLVWGDIKDRLETVGVNQSQICCVAWRGSAGPGSNPDQDLKCHQDLVSTQTSPQLAALLQLSLGDTITLSLVSLPILSIFSDGSLLCPWCMVITPVILSYLNLEKIYRPPGRLLRLGLGTLSSLVHDGWDTIHSVGRPPLSRHATGGCWLVSTIRKVKQMISHARMLLLGDIDSADRNVLCLLPASVHTG